MHDLAEVAGVDIAPGIALSRRQIGQEAGKHVVFMRLDDVRDPQRIDVDAVAHGEGARGLFIHDLGKPVGVHGIGVVVLLEREASEILLAFGKTDAVGGLAGGDHDLADAEFCRGFDHIIGADRVDAERLVIRLDQHPRYRGKMHDGVRRRRRPAGFETVEAEMRGQGVEGLAAVRQIGDQGTDAGMIERLEIDIEKVVALALQMRQDVPAGLAGSPGEYHALACHFRFLVRR